MTLQQAIDGRLPPDAQERFDERAGIMQFDGGLSRREAEVAAFRELFGGKS